MNLFWCKANIKRFGFNNLHQDFDIIGIVHTAMDACRHNRSKENVYNERFMNVYLAFLIWKKLFLDVEFLFLFLSDQKNHHVVKNPTFSNIIPRAKHVLNTFTIREFSVISSTLVGEGESYSLSAFQSVYSTAPAPAPSVVCWIFVSKKII